MAPALLAKALMDGDSRLTPAECQRIVTGVLKFWNASGHPTPDEWVRLAQTYAPKWERRIRNAVQFCASVGVR